MVYLIISISSCLPDTLSSPGVIPSKEFYIIHCIYMYIIYLYLPCLLWKEISNWDFSILELKYFLLWYNVYMYQSMSVFMYIVPLQILKCSMKTSDENQYNVHVHACFGSGITSHMI